METITGGHLLVRTLLAHGINRVYSIPGAPLFPFYEGCLDEGLEVIVGRHEEALVHTAEGWSRTSGKPSFVLLAPGPGHSNGIPAIATAHAECSPVIVMSGIDNLAKTRQGSPPRTPTDRDGATHHEMVGDPLGRKTDPRVHGPRVSHSHDRNARAGPHLHHVRLPGWKGESSDLTELTNPAPSKTRPTSAPGADPEFVEQALALLAGAERPVIIAGVAAFWSQAGPVLQQFIETAKLPLFTVEQARGLVPDKHPYCFGDGYSTINPVAQLLSRADVILLLGERIDCAFSYGGCFGPAKIIQICPNPEEIGKNHPVELGVACDARVVMTQLLTGAPSQNWGERTAWLKELNDANRGMPSAC